ncbi:MAG: replication initiator protein A, partial [Alphaproteobacteria bacterium]|nr:replication initiator protein A [Alphaproteobacteria bacterium]MBU1834718.1 replication initiator protein A [Alphaproteobacteria bacterium]
IQAKEVLTLHRNYFRLRKPLERRIYEIARKHCGSKQEWRIGLESLQRKCGSASTSREFRRLVGNIVAQDEAHSHMPDYGIRLEADMVVFINREPRAMGPALVDAALSRLDPDTYSKAREAAPGWDVYHLEQEWRVWMADGGLDAPANPDKAFLGFCRKIYERRGRP